MKSTVIALEINAVLLAMGLVLAGVSLVLRRMAGLIEAATVLLIAWAAFRRAPGESRQEPGRR